MFRVYINHIGAGPSSVSQYDLVSEMHAKRMFQEACSPLLNVDVFLQVRVVRNDRVNWELVKQWHKSEEKL
jgi:hypothetical protein